MIDRSPKYPGRVKLIPVSGQENTYDMMRADEPDDTGTPFNKRTMIQDSTGRFLRLPVSNPFVDDALRHMPDRIEPIGTVKTSPALSLGDAWLPCDGSQVTFAGYPALCQILRNTVGDVTWDGITVGTTPNFQEMSQVVKFKGKFYVAGCYYNKPNGVLSYTYTLSIAAHIQLVTLNRNMFLEAALTTQHTAAAHQSRWLRQTISWSQFLILAAISLLQGLYQLQIDSRCCLRLMGARG